MLYKFCMLCQYHCHVTQAGILLWCVIVLCIMYDKNLKLKVCANFFAAFLSIFSAIFVSKYFHYDSLSSKLRLCFNCDIVQYVQNPQKYYLHPLLAFSGNVHCPLYNTNQFVNELYKPRSTWIHQIPLVNYENTVRKFIG